MAMNILITNDDGIDALGIRLLIDWAKRLGAVTVVAPKTEQSGKSHGIELTRPIEIRPVDLMDGVTAYSVDSTPADCIRFGILGLQRRYDLVLSGINRGANLGKDIVYSGTVGAVFEAAALNHRAVALSTAPDTLEEAAVLLDRTFAFLERTQLLANHPIYNINIPANAAGIGLTRQGESCFRDVFIPLCNHYYAQSGSYRDDDDAEDTEIDSVAFQKGIISVTPLRFSRTETEVLNSFQATAKESFSPTER